MQITGSTTSDSPGGLLTRDATILHLPAVGACRHLFGGILRIRQEARSNRWWWFLFRNGIVHCQVVLHFWTTIYVRQHVSNFDLMHNIDMEIPLELTDRFIDFLHSDRYALAACSLVCKNWLPASRYHFFQITVLNLTTRNVAAFVELLNSPACTIAKHALAIQIAYNSTFDTISPYLAQLKINSLYLMNMQWDISEENLEEKFGSIPALHLAVMTFPDRNRFNKLLAYFPSLETLSIRAAAFWIEDHTTSFTPPPRLRRVELGFDKDLTWFLSAVQFPALNHIEIGEIARGSVDTVRASLKPLGPSIHTLILRFGCGYDIRDCLDLTQCTDLRYLAIRGIREENVARQSLPHIFSQIPSFDLGSVEVDLWASIENVDWNQLAQVLTQPRFTKLQNIRIRVVTLFTPPSHVYYHCDSCAEQVRQEMSGLGNTLDILVTHIPP